MIGAGAAVARGIVRAGKLANWTVEITVEDGPSWVFWYSLDGDAGGYDTLYTVFSDVPLAMAFPDESVEWQWLERPFAEDVASESWRQLAIAHAATLASIEPSDAEIMLAAEEAGYRGSIVMDGGEEIEVWCGRGAYWARRRSRDADALGQSQLALGGALAVRPLAGVVRGTVLAGDRVRRFVEVEVLALVLASAAFEAM